MHKTGNAAARARAAALKNRGDLGSASDKSFYPIDHVSASFPYVVEGVFVRTMTRRELAIARRREVANG